MEKFIKYIGLSNFIALDLETTGLNPKEDKIIEISAYKFNNGIPIESFTYLINPQHAISTTTTQITGIDAAMVKDKPIFTDIEIDFVSFLSDYPIVGHNIIFDMSFLKIYLINYESVFGTRMICDTFYLSKIYYYYHNSFSLSSLCQNLDIEILESHRAEEDAKNSGLLFMKILEKIKNSNLLLVQKLKSCIGNFNVPNNKLFNNVLNYLIKYDEDIDRKINHYSHPSFSFVHRNKLAKEHSIEQLFKNDGLIEKKLKGYELRSEQIQFAEDILNALDEKYSLVVEAGAGLGKSYAYLFSSLLYGKKNKKQIVISTNTHSLQNQLFHKDIPFVVNILNQDCRATIAKGINNYICLTRLEDVLNGIEKKINKYEAMELSSLFLWIQNTESGDISECAGFNYRYYSHLWLLINARSEFCLTYKCNRHNGCYYSHIKKQAKKSDILIVNHSMMISYQDKQDNFILDDAICIVDECHNFPSICQKQSSKSVSVKKIKECKDSYLRISKSLEKNKENNFKIQNRNLLEIIDDVIDSFQNFSESFYSLNVTTQAKSEYTQNISINRDGIFPSNDATAQNYLVILNKLIVEIKSYKSTLYNHEENISKNTLQEFDFLLSSFEDLYLTSDIIINNKDNSINWFSYRYMNIYLDNFSFSYAPENLQEIADNIFGSFPSTIFCSATLSTGSDFDFFIRQMGFNDLVYQDEIKLKKYPSPYYYSDQTKLFIINTESQIDSESHIKKIASDIFDIHLKINKRILVLCTSFKQIYDFERIIKSLSRGQNNHFLFQKKGVSRDLLLSDYLKYSNSVLFGTNTFWEGIDLPKDKLEILIIFKLPFSNPKDPFIKANIDYYNSHNLDAFSQYQLQDAIIKLKQGFGRLIRGYDDMGVCIITDPRLTKRRYGRHVIDSLPVEPIYYSSSSLITCEIENFLN